MRARLAKAQTVIGIDATVAMYIAAFIIIAYTFLGGFNAVCWTDFFQGLLMLAALLIAPLSGHMASYFAILFIAGGTAGALYTLVMLDVTNGVSSEQGMRRISCVAAEPRVLRIEHLLPQS